MLCRRTRLVLASPAASAVVGRSAARPTAASANATAARLTRYRTRNRERSRGAPVDSWAPMGNVVELDNRKRRRKPRSKTALVLGGGGFTGAVYEIGALRALDLLSVNRTINDFDVYVGTSAGSLVGALTANGVTPEQMMRVVNDQVVPGFPPIQREMLLRPNYREFVTKGVKLPFHLLGVLRTLGANLGSVSMMDVAIALADALPSGAYSGSGVEAYVREVLA